MQVAAGFAVMAESGSCEELLESLPEDIADGENVSDVETGDDIETG